MSVGERLKEERNRLGMSQSAFAALAGATKGAQLKWEKDEASPNALALIAFAEAGADVLYILTGRHAPDRPENAVSQIEDDLSEIERDLLNPGRLYPGLDDEQTDERVVPPSVNRLRAMLTADRPFLTPELEERASSLLDIASDRLKLALFRAADYAQMKKKREQMKGSLTAWLDDGEYLPNDVVMHQLVALAIEYAVPVKFVAELVSEIHADILRGQPPRRMDLSS